MGRKPVLLGINKSRRYIVSIDFYYQKSIFCLYNLRNEVQNEFVVHQSPQQGFAAWVQTAMGAIHTLLSMKKMQPADLAAIGISSPGVIQRNQSLILNGPMYGTFDPNGLYSSLVAEFCCKVYIKNSTNASALGEWENGKFRRAPNLVYISCGLGLGAGIITQGKLYEGSNAAAGEIANFVYPETVNTEMPLEKRICIATLLESN